MAPIGWAATPTAFIRWVHTLINPHWCKKTNKVTLNGKGLVGAARGNGAESALAKASKPFSYWQMKSELLSKICDFPQSPLIRFLSLALPPPFFSYALSEVLSTACSRQKVRFASFPSLPTCRRKMAQCVTGAVLYVWKWLYIKKGIFSPGMWSNKLQIVIKYYIYIEFFHMHCSCIPCNMSGE